MELADTMRKMSLVMKSFVAWRRHLYVLKQVRKQKSIEDQVSKSHYESMLCQKAFKVLVSNVPTYQKSSPPASGPNTESIGVQANEALPAIDFQNKEYFHSSQHLKSTSQKSLGRILYANRSKLNSDIPPLDIATSVTLHNLLLSNGQADDTSNEVEKLRSQKLLSNDSYLRILSLPNTYELRICRKALSALVGFKQLQNFKSLGFRQTHLANLFIETLRQNVKVQRLDRIGTKIVDKRLKDQKQNGLDAWLRLMTVVQKARKFNRIRKLKNGMRLLGSNVEFERAVLKGFNGMRLANMRRTYAKLVQFCQEGYLRKAGQERYFKEKQLSKCRQIFKVWFNMVNLTRKCKKLQVISQKITSNSVLRQTLQKWRHKCNFTDFKQRNYHRFLSKFFEPWLRLSIQKQHSRETAILRYAHRLNSQAFEALKQYTVQQKDRKQRLLGIFQLRATGITRTAFQKGWLVYHREYKLRRSMNKLASFFLAKRIQKDAFQKFVCWHRLQRKGTLIRQKHQFLQAAIALKEWTTLAKLKRKLRKYEHRKETRQKHAAFMRFKIYLSKKRLQKRRIEIGLKRYAVFLMKTTFKGFGQMMDYKYEMECKHRKAVQMRDQWLVAKGLSVLRQNCNLEYSLRQKFNQVRYASMLSLKRLAMEGLQENTRHELTKKRAVPLVTDIKLKLKGRVMDSLLHYSFQKRERRTLVRTFIRNSEYTKSQNCFEMLVQYTQHSIIKNHLNRQATQYRHFQLKKTAMRALFLKQMFAAEDGSMTQCVQSNLRTGIFIRWYNYVHDLRPKMNLADMQYKRTRFLALVKHVQKREPARVQRRKLLALQNDYGQARLAQLGLTWLYLHSQKSIYFKSKLQLCSQIWKKRLFAKWSEVVPLLRLQNHFNGQVTQFRTSSLQVKTFLSLRQHTRRQQYYRRLISDFKQRSSTKMVCMCVAAMIDAAHETKLRALQFIDKLRPIVAKSKAVVMCKWISYNAAHMKLEMGDQFYLRNKGLRTMYKCWHALAHYAVKKQLVRMKEAKADNHYGKRVLQVAILKIKQFGQQNFEQNKKVRQISQSVRRSTLVKVIQELRSYTTLNLQRQHKGLQVEKLRQRNQLRLVMWSLLKNRQTNTIALMVAQQRGINLKQTFLQRWIQVQKFYKKIEVLMDHFHAQHEKRLVHNFLPNLQFAGNFKQVQQSSGQRRKRELLRTALDGFMDLLVVKRMNEVVIERVASMRLQKVFSSMKAQIEISRSYRLKIDQQIDHQNLEESMEIKRTIFQRLQKHHYWQRAKKSALSLSCRTLVTKAFKTIRGYTLRKTQLKFMQLQYVREQKVKFFGLWFKASTTVPREKAAGGLLQFSRLNQVFNELRIHARKQRIINDFRVLWGQKRLKYMTLRGFQHRVLIKQFHQFVYDRITARREQAVAKAALDLLAQGCKQSQLSSGLVVFSNHKLKKRFFNALREYVIDRNQQRLSLIKIRATFANRPALRKPLLVLRNLTMYQAFIALRLKTQRLRDLRQQSQLASYAAYLRLQRKAFYGLRLNAAQKFQQHTSFKLKKLYIQRRWFRNLRKVCHEQKTLRQLNMTATIARFLNLQRKALKSLIINHSVRKQSRILQTFSATLYYKNLCTRVFLSLQIYAMAKRETMLKDQQNQHNEKENQCSSREKLVAKQDHVTYAITDVANVNVHNSSLLQSNNYVMQAQNFYQPKQVYSSSQNREVMNMTADNVTHKQHVDSLSNEFVISQAEMGPISMVNYQKLRNVPQTMLEENRAGSQCSSAVNSRGPSALSMFLPMTPPSDSQY